MKREASSTVANWSASILSTVSADTEPALMITFDNAKYMFNAGENTIRSFTHSETNRKKMKAVFLTQLRVERAGGIAGLLMTLADASAVNELNVTGPYGLLHYLASMRFYTFRDNLRVSPVEIAPPTSSSPPSSTDPSPIFKDENIAVYALPLVPETVPEPFSASELSPVGSDTSLKRKRSQSPDEPRKRTNTAGETSVVNPSQNSLEHVMAEPGFKPGSLTGQNAQDWRRLLIQTMFPATVLKTQGTPDASPSKGKGKTKGKQKETAKEEDTPASNSVSLAFPTDKDAEKVDEYRRARRRLPKGYHEQLPPPFPASSSEQPSSGRVTTPVGYVVVGPRIRGKFDVARATELGVPFGPLRGKLTRGESVTFTVKEKIVGEDGKEEIRSREVTVNPEHCVGESEAPSVAIVLDVPDKTYIPSLLQHFDGNLFSKLRSTKEEDRKEHMVKAVFHICGEGVLEDPRYVEFMKGFGENIDHVVSSKEHCPNRISFTSAAFNQLRLNKLDKDMFPLQKYRMEPTKLLSDVPQNVHFMTPNLKVGIRPYSKPAKDPQAEGKDLFHPLLENTKSGTPEVYLPDETFQKFKEAWTTVAEVAKMHSDNKRPGDDIIVTPLGTGSAIPGRYRTVSSTLIQIPNWGNILLDAGEGTYYQLSRHFGEDGVKQVLRDLKCLYISHVHGDHHMGAAMLLRKRKQLDPPPSEPLYLVSIRTVQLYLQEIQQLQDLDIRPVNSVAEAGNGVIPVMSEALHWKRPGVYQTTGYWAMFGDEPWLDAGRSVTLANNLCQSLGLKSIATVDMRHGTKCYGLVLRHQDKWSIAFSGDTEACDNLVYAGQGATLLIHEATMADDQAEMAKQKKHSTFGQAIDIGKRMNAQAILLTHFSARHPKVPMSLMDITDSQSPSPPPSPGSRFRRPLSPSIALAFDQSTLRIGDMWKMKYYLPALEQNYKDTIAIDGEDEEPEGAMDVGV